MSKVTVITINYNNAEGLEDTIQSVINQNFKDFEYIVIDGASTDSSIDIIKKYEEDIDYWVSEIDSGIYNAMNKGILQAKGEYILFINSGDTIYKNNVLSEVFSVPRKTDLIYGDLHRVFPDKQEDIVKMPEVIDFYFIYNEALSHPTTFIKRSLFQQYGLYREDLKIVSDWAFFFKLISFTNISKEHIPLIISSFKMDGISSNNKLVVQSERQKVIEESLSYELREICLNYRTFNEFYHKRYFQYFRKFKLLQDNIFSLRSWIELIHKKRLNNLIQLINKTVRKQKKDPFSIPIIIINYNRLNDLRNLVFFLQQRKHKNIVIVDNNSIYPPLLKYYKEIAHEVVIERMDQNYGHLVFWKKPYLYQKYAKGYYIITDSDILPNDDLPNDYINQLREILDQNKDVAKVGFALKITDIPDNYIMKESVLEWEKKHWENSIGKNLYLTELDTTFAIYPPYYRYKHITEFYKGIRISGDFLAKHMGWYMDVNNLSEEDEFYLKTSNSSSSWKFNKDGVFAGNNQYVE